ncbi:unnamed protein product [Calypogeia fissa]
MEHPKQVEPEIRTVEEEEAGVRPSNPCTVGLPDKTQEVVPEEVEKVVTSPEAEVVTPPVERVIIPPGLLSEISAEELAVTPPREEFVTPSVGEAVASSEQFNTPSLEIEIEAKPVSVPEVESDTVLTESDKDTARELEGESLMKIVVSFVDPKILAYGKNKEHKKFSSEMGLTELLSLPWGCEIGSEKECQ